MINSAQWIQAKKQGVVINFKQWRDWRGLPLFGMEWYKDTVPKVTPKMPKKLFLFNLFFQDEQYSVTEYAYITNGNFKADDEFGKQPYTCQYTLPCLVQN